MTKRRFGFLIILGVFAAVALIALALYFANNSPSDPSARNISLWYVNDDALWNRLESEVRDYNAGEGQQQGISVSLQGFSSEQELKEGVSNAIANGDELPQLIICDLDHSAWLHSQGLTIDVHKLIPYPEALGISARYLKAASLEDTLISIPLAAQTDLLIYNKKLLDSMSGIKSFEELCSVATEHYKEKKAGFFTIQDYASFFQSACAQLGGSFDGVSPHNTDDAICKYVYNCLAQTAYNRGYSSHGDNVARLVALGEMPCAIVSSAAIIGSVDTADSDSLGFADYPVMDGGEALCIESVTGLSVLNADEDRLENAAKFIRWLASKEVNGEFTANSGYIPASGIIEAVTTNRLDSSLKRAICDKYSNSERITQTASAEYSLNSFEFNNVLATIMESFN